MINWKTKRIPHPQLTYHVGFHASNLLEKCIVIVHTIDIIEIDFVSVSTISLLVFGYYTYHRYRNQFVSVIYDFYIVYWSCVVFFYWSYVVVFFYILTGFQLDFSTLQDKHNIYTLSKNIKFICTSCETGLKTSPKTCVSTF